MKKALSLLLLLLAVVLPVAAHAQKRPILYPPYVILAFERNIQRGALRAVCKQVKGGARSAIDCTFQTTNFWNKLKRSDLDAESAKYVNYVVQDWDRCPDWADYVGRRRAYAADADYATKVRAICPTKDPDLLFEATRQWLADTEVKTCKVHLHGWEERFVKKSASLWVGVSTNRGPCDDTYVSTIWLEDPDLPLWSYKQEQRTPLKTPQDPFCAKDPGTVRTHEYTPMPEPVDLQAELGCQFFELLHPKKAKK